MKAVSLFSGVGAFELALQRKDIKTVLSCEIDKYACEVLRHRFPDTEVFNGDVRTLTGEYIREKYGEIDIITAGFPCQTFSIAGKREGFQDITRGTLFFEIIRLANELGKPAYIFLENVKGLLTHEEGRTFGVILESLGELGYDVEWQVLNSKDFGVPQNRERVFVVGHSREKSTRQIFPVRATSRPPLNGESTRCIDANYWKGIDNHGARTAIGTCLRNVRTDEGKRLRKKYEKGELDHGFNEHRRLEPRKDDATNTLTGVEKDNLITVGTWRTHKDGEGFREVKSGLCPTIPARAREDGSGQPVIIDPNYKKEGLRIYKKTCPTLNQRDYKDPKMVATQSAIRRLTPVECQMPVIMQDVLRPNKKQNGKGFKSNEFYSLTTQAEMGVMLRDGRDNRSCLRAGRTTEVGYQGQSIRRLTPVECQRLQGFPDDLYDGIEMSDTQKYKQMGNSITVNVLEAIFKNAF